MGLFDTLSNLANGEQNPLESLGEIGSTIRNAASELSEVKGIGMPQELQNLRDTENRLTQSLQTLEASLAAGTAQPRELTYLRTDLQNHFNHIRQGGEPLPVSPVTIAAIKANPLYHQVKANYPALVQKLQALEQKYANCTYGYQMADGSIQEPNMDWSDEQLQQIQASSVQTSTHCWLNSDHTQYFS